MHEMTFDDLLGYEAPKIIQEDVFSVMKDLGAGSCRECPLGYHSPNNTGFLWRGNPEASIAVIGDYPSAMDMDSKKAFADENGIEIRRWLEMANILEHQVFMTYLVQCKTRLKKDEIELKDDEKTMQRSPQRELEVHPCLHGRLLRTLRAMPNLEVIIGLGPVVWEALLGSPVGTKTHQGIWRGTDLLPGKAVFCLPHPRTFDNETGETKRGRLRQCMNYFRTDYFGRVDDGEQVVPPKKILSILRLREQQRVDARPKGIL